MENLRSLSVVARVFLKGLYWGPFFSSVMVNDLAAKKRNLTKLLSGLALRQRADLL